MSSNCIAPAALQVLHLTSDYTAAGLPAAAAAFTDGGQQDYGRPAITEVPEPWFRQRVLPRPWHDCVLS